MKKKNPFSSLHGLFLLVTIPPIIILIILYLSTLKGYRDSNASAIRANERLVISSVEHSVGEVSYVLQSTVQSSDFLFFSNSSPFTRVSKYATSLNSLLRKTLTANNEVVGYILYNSSCDQFFNMYFTSRVSSLHSVLSLGDNTSATDRFFGIQLLQFNDQHFILCILQQRYGTIIVILDPTRNNDFRSFSNLYTDSASIYFAPAGPVGGAAAGNVIQETFSDLPLKLCFSQQRSGPLSGFSFEQALVFWLIGAIIYFVITVWFIIHRRLITPLLRLSDSMDIIAQGDLSYRITSTSKVHELARFYDGFNHMLDSIESAKIESAKNEVDAAQAKLQYLQLQIRPHFYLNCLKNISALAVMHEDEKIQELVIFLSDYFRYSFQDVRSTIPLRQELEAAQSYVSLCQVLDNPISLEFDVESDTLSGKCPPLSVLTFLENSIKHGQAANSIIQISARIILSDDGNPYNEITIRDNGKGFSEEMLEQLNKADPTKLIYSKEHVGIANVRFRMWLRFREKASVTFGNHDSSAEVVLRFPFEPFVEPLVESLKS